MLLVLDSSLSICLWLMKCLLWNKWIHCFKLFFSSFWNKACWATDVHKGRENKDVRKKHLLKFWWFIISLLMWLFSHFHCDCFNIYCSPLSRIRFCLQIGLNCLTWLLSSCLWSRWGKPSGWFKSYCKVECQYCWFGNPSLQEFILLVVLCSYTISISLNIFL